MSYPKVTCAETASFCLSAPERLAKPKVTNRG